MDRAPVGLAERRPPRAGERLRCPRLAPAVGSVALAAAIVVGPTACGLAPSPVPPPARVPTIGYLQPIANGPSPYLDRFREGLRAHGYVEGQNIAIDPRAADAGTPALAERAAELVALEVEVIVAVSTAAARAARAATSSIPIVGIGIGSDPVALGLVESLARPGGNVTGVFVNLAELSGKQLELLKEAAPTTSRVAVLTNSGNPALVAALRELQASAQMLGVEVQLLEVGEPDDVERGLEAATRSQVDALLTLHDTSIFLQRQRIVDFAARRRLPAMYEFREWTDTGGLMAYGPSLADSYRRAATYVDRILRGAKPADLPVEQLTRFELVLNLKTARALGLTLPQALLTEADDVIQ